MSRFLLEFIFALLALGGIIMLICGIRLRPDEARREGDAGEEILLDFPCQSDESDPEGIIRRDEKRAFDPDKHKPEEIVSRKKN